MKQFAFMIVVTLYGSVGTFTINPFCGPFVYYFYAILRPQFMWEWTEFLGRRMFEVPWSLIVAVPSIIAALLGMHGGKDDPEHPHALTGAHFATLLFALWISVSYVMALDKEAAWFWYIEYIKIFVMYFVSWFIIRTTGQVWALFVMIGVTLGYIAYEINFLYLVNHYLSLFRRGYGGLDNNGAGLMIAMGVPVCWFCFEGFQKWWRWAFVLFIPMLVHAVLMTYSRGAMLSLLVVVPWMVFRSRQRVRLSFALVAFMVLALPILAGAEIRARFLTIQESEIDDSANARRQSWNAAWLIAKDYPVFGAGIRNSNLLSHQYGADIEGRTIHSQYFQILADNGFPGLALYLAVLGSAWLAVRKPMRLTLGCEDTESRRVRAMASGIESSMLVYCFGSIFLSLEVFELPYLLLLLAAQLPVVHRDASVDETSEASSAEVKPEGYLEQGHLGAPWHAERETYRERETPPQRETRQGTTGS